MRNEINTPQNLQESQSIEWKESWQDEYLKWICGFANAQGGRTHIGKNDSGKVIGGRFEGIHRIEELEYPASALREMLLNALVHRNYLGSMTQLKVFNDKLSLWNAGALPVELTIEKLFQTHESFPRNPLIADVCYKAGYIDSWGRGVEKITDACREAQLPAPNIFERSGGIVVELTKEMPLQKQTGQISETSGKDYGMISERIRKEFGSEPVKAFEIICQYPEFTAKQIAEKLEKTPRTIENYIAKLKKTGFIVRRGPKLGGHWEVIKL
ncbi:HTH domain-containing protein [bacterium]|nr:HTH domain-containing protein [bacterium]